MRTCKADRRPPAPSCPAGVRTLAVIVPGALVWSSRRAPEKTASIIEPIAVIGLGLLISAVVVATAGPMAELMEYNPAPEPIFPAAR